MRAQGTHVLAAFPSSTDTAMLVGLDGDKENPADVAEGIIDGLARGLEDISVGRHAVDFEALSHSDPKAVEREFAQFLPGTGVISDQ